LIETAGLRAFAAWKAFELQMHSFVEMRQQNSWEVHRRTGNGLLSWCHGVLIVSACHRGVLWPATVGFAAMVRVAAGWAAVQNPITERGRHRDRSLSED